MLKRLPEFQSILQVYAVIAVMFAGWTITAFLWKLTAWLLLLNLGEVFAIFSYAMAANFLESLIVMATLLTACALLPTHILRDDFAVRGTILSIALTGSLMAFVGARMHFGLDGGWRLLLAPMVILLLTIFFLGFLSRSPFWRSTALWLSDRVMIFLFILLPLFGMLSIYVIFRNIV